MVVETYSDKEVVVGTCEMSPEMFQEAIKLTKEAIGSPTSAEAANKIKSCFDEKYGGNWWSLLVKAIIIYSIKHLKLLLNCKYSAHVKMNSQ